MATLDTLQILIEADSKGLETQLKRAGNQITGFIDQMNSQEVNWQSILAGSLNMAIISGIASLFATAISSAVSFQTAMVTAGQNSQNAFTDNLGQISNSVRGISNTTGASATDVADGMAKMVQLFGDDTPTAIAAMNGAAQLASITGANLGDVVNMLIPIFDNWGINSVPGVTKAITDLLAASKTGKIGIQDLANTVGNAGVQLRDHTDFSTTAYQIEQISMQSGMTKDKTVEAFNKIAESVINTMTPLNLLSGGIGAMGKAVDTEGIVGAFEKISGAIQKSGMSATLWGQATGLDVQLVQILGKQAPAAYNASAAAADKAAKSAGSLNDQFTQSLTFTKELQILFTAIFNKLGEAFDSVNNKLGNFVGQLLTAKGPLEMLDVLGGPLGNSSTPAVLGNAKYYQDPQKPLPFSVGPIPNLPPGIGGGITNNWNITNNIQGGNGNGQSIGTGISSSLYNLMQGTSK